MRNEEISNETKNRMADALKQLLSTKSPEKITVKDITTLANVSRPTFYYHFRDLHALTEFMFNRELTDLLKGHCEGDSLSDAVLIILRFLKKNTAFYTTISEGVGYSELSLLFDGCIEDMISQYTHHLNEQIGAKEADVAFIIDFYTKALAGCLVTWMRSGMTTSPEEMQELFLIAADRTISGALKRSVEKHGSTKED